MTSTHTTPLPTGGITGRSASAPASAPAGPQGRATDSAGAAVGEATQLLEAYGPGAHQFFASPTRTLLGRGTAAEVPHDERPLTERVRHTLRARQAAGDPHAVVLGAIPFDQTAPAALVVPEALSTAGPLAADPLIALPAPAARDGAWHIREHPPAQEYARTVATAVERLRKGEFGKVVLARTLELTPGAAGQAGQAEQAGQAGAGAEGLDIPRCLQRLARRDSDGYVFAMPTGPDRTLLGASPELLVSRRGQRFVANPLAGSVPRSADPAEDVRGAVALLESAKDQHEHAVVVRAVREALTPLARSLEVSARPTLLRTAAMWHLSTTVTGELADPGVSALELACALHPTPAVCGTPTAHARGVIEELEPFERGYFAGMVGWGNAEGDGEWVVTLRCAEAEGRRLRLYAGAGIVAGSSPEAETAETGAKFSTFLHATGATR